MQNKSATKTKIFITSFVTILIAGLLVWQNFHGGVPSHHFLQRKDLPEISNWWGMLLLPIFTWVLSGRIESRLDKQGVLEHQLNSAKLKIIGLFFLGLILGISLAVSFVNDYKFFLDNVLYLILALSLVFTIYYPEFILGFVLSMTYTFGAILPTIFISIMAVLGFLIYKLSRLITSGIVKLFGH